MFFGSWYTQKTCIPLFVFLLFVCNSCQQFFMCFVSCVCDACTAWRNKYFFFDFLMTMNFSTNTQFWILQKLVSKSLISSFSVSCQQFSEGIWVIAMSIWAWRTKILDWSSISRAVAEIGKTVKTKRRNIQSKEREILKAKKGRYWKQRKRNIESQRRRNIENNENKHWGYYQKKGLKDKSTF